MLYLIIFFSSLIITIFTTPYWIDYLKSRKLVDDPSDERKIHTVPTPRMGGLIIYIMAVVSLFSYNGDSTHVKLLIFASMVVALIGLIDDLRSLRWNVKFLLQSVAVLHLLYLFHDYFDTMRFFSFTIPFPLDYVFLFFFILGTINSINLMDGMDGLVGGFSLLVLVLILVLSVISQNHMLLVLTSSLLGGVLGFLKYNASPAKIFLGDTGSLTLGFFLVVLTLFTSLEQYNRTIDLTFAVMMLAVPILDTLKVMVVRMASGKSMFLPDKNHLHHIVLGTFIKSKTTVFIILSLSVLFITDGLIYLKYSESIGIIMFLVLGSLLLAMRKILHTSSYLLRVELFHQTFSTFSEKSLLKVKDILVYLSGAVSFLMLIGFFPSSAEINKGILLTLMVIVLLMLLLALFNYKRTKTYSDIYVFLNLIIFISLSFFSDTIVASNFLHSAYLQYFFVGAMFTLLALVVFFMLCKNCYPIEKKSFLTGLDLIFISLISLSFILHQFIQDQGYIALGVNGFYALILYIWYKIISSVNERYHRILFHTSFMVPFIAMIYIYLS